MATIVGVFTIILAPAGSRFRSLADLRGKTVGVVREGVSMTRSMPIVRS